MRYLVTGRIRPGKYEPLLRAIENRTLGRGSVAGGEYIRNMKNARKMENGDLRDAHARHNCKDATGEEPWACSHCDCTKKLEEKMEGWGVKFPNENFVNEESANK